MNSQLYTCGRSGGAGEITLVLRRSVASLRWMTGAKRRHGGHYRSLRDDHSRLSICCTFWDFFSAPRTYA